MDRDYSDAAYGQLPVNASWLSAQTLAQMPKDLKNDGLVHADDEEIAIELQHADEVSLL